MPPRWTLSNVLCWRPPLNRKFVATRRYSVIAVTVLALIVACWSSAGRQVAAAVPAAGGGAARPSLAASLLDPPPTTTCVQPTVPGTPLPTATATSVPTPTPTVIPVPTPAPGGETNASDCVVALIQSGSAPLSQYNEIFNPPGRSHTFTFVCGHSVIDLVPPVTNPFPQPGCFNVRATFTDTTTGARVAFTSGECAGTGVAGGNVIDCTSIANPICPAGTQTDGGAPCSPCPAGFGPGPDDLCSAPPTGATCPPGSTPVLNTGGGVAECVAPRLSPFATAQNEANFIVTPPANHRYRIDVTGYFGTDSNGNCPAGTTLVRAGTVPNSTNPACAFHLQLFKSYAQEDLKTITQLTDCTGSGTFGGGSAPCFFLIRITGAVVIQLNVNCGSPGVPTGSAEPAGFPPGSVYVCTNNTLSVDHVPVAHLQITVSASNGLFLPTCVPQSRAPGPEGTVTPTNTPTPSPTPTGTPTAPTGGFTHPGFCFQSGVGSIVLTTDDNGVAGHAGTEAEVSAIAVPRAGTSAVTITGRFTVDGNPVQGVPMFTTMHFASQPDILCDGRTTDATGTAQCNTSTGAAPLGSLVTVDVSFIYNCTEYGTTTTFRVGDPGSATLSSAQLHVQDGICAVLTGAPPLSLFIALPGIPTPTPAPPPTDTPIPPPPSTITPTPTNTPAVTASNTPAAPTPSPIPTPSPTPIRSSTPTPKPSPTPLHTLNFSLDAARVAKPNNPGNMQGVDHVTRGQKVWLMMYYTVSAVPKAVSRVTAYQIRVGQAVVYRASFKGRQNAGEVGHFSRYTAYTVSRTLPLGVYMLEADLQLGAKKKTRSWRFAVVRSGALFGHSIGQLRAYRRN